MKRTVLYLLIMLLLSVGCSSDPGKNGETGGDIAENLPKEDGIISIKIVSPALNNGWSGKSSGSGSGGTTGYQKGMILDAGTDAQLNAVGYDIRGNSYDNIQVEWTSNYPNVAIVDDTGKVSGISTGETIITAELSAADGEVLSDTVVATVLPPPATDKEWVSAAPLPLAMWDHASTIWNGYIYVAGGNSSCTQYLGNCGFTDRFYYAPINPDGSMGEFKQTTPMPQFLRGHVLLAYRNYMYIIGGIVQRQYKDPPYPDPLNYETVLNEKVYYTSINPDGSIGVWNETSRLPSPEEGVPSDKAGLFALSATVHEINNKGYIYVTGGWNVELKRNVRNLLIGPVNDDGSISDWLHDSKSDLPYSDGLSKHATVAVNVNGNSYLYIIGGNSGDLYSDAFHKGIYYAKIGSDGLISSNGPSSPWRSATHNLPVELIDHAAVVIGGDIIVLGGRNRDDDWVYTSYSYVYFYSVQDTGDLGPLNRYVSIPTSLFHHAAVADNNTTNIYVTGGASGDTAIEENRKNNVYYLTSTGP